MGVSRLYTASFGTPMPSSEMYTARALLYQIVILKFLIMDLFNSIDSSFITMVITIATFFVAYRTLVFQKKTFKNTKSLVKPKEAMTTYLIDIYMNFMTVELYIFSLKKHFKEKGYEIEFSKVFSQGQLFDLTDFNNAMFYENTLSYRFFNQFKHRLSLFNEQYNAFFLEEKYNKEKVDFQLNELKSNLMIIYFTWYVLIIHLISNQLKEIETKPVLGKVVLWFKLLINKKKVISKRAKDAQKVFENLILSLFENSESFLYGIYDSDVSVFSEDTVSTVLLKDFKAFLISEYNKTHNLNSNIEKIVWDHFILHLISDEDKKVQIKAYLDDLFFKSNQLFSKAIYSKEC
jgi:hypothetical protein